ncbi:MAG: hypothetical protein QOH67_342 [Hyphomicrobiales bacterium]|nr:hypothetical protein [Hyphomicrobiales bacterium]
MRAFAIACVLLALAGAADAESRSPVCGTLEQCDAVIRTAPGIAAYERRGYLHLMQRRGLEDLYKAIDDFSAAIAIEARPFALYARGMARLMSGDAAGQNEMEAAIMLQRDIAEEFKRYGAE